MKTIRLAIVIIMTFAMLKYNPINSTIGAS
jgi:hypothetical protein